MKPINSFLIRFRKKAIATTLLAFAIPFPSGCTYLPPARQMQFPSLTPATLVIAKVECTDHAARASVELCRNVSSIIPGMTEAYFAKRGFRITRALAGKESEHFIATHGSTAPPYRKVTDADLVFLFSIGFRERPQAEVAREMQTSYVPLPLEHFPLIPVAVPRAEIFAQVAIFDSRKGTLLQQTRSSHRAAQLDRDAFAEAYPTLLKILLARGPHTGTGDWYYD